MTFFNKIVLTFFMFTFLLASNSFALDQYTVKSVYMYNFTKFTKFPPSAGNNITICTIGADPFGTTLDKVAGSIKEKQVFIKRGIALPDAKLCNVLFISYSEKRKLNQILKKLENEPIITVSDIEGFSELGGIVEFVGNDEEKIKFIINNKAARKAKLFLETLLLETALRVIR